MRAAKATGLSAAENDALERADIDWHNEQAALERMWRNS